MSLSRHARKAFEPLRHLRDGCGVAASLAACGVAIGFSFQETAAPVPEIRFPASLTVDQAPSPYTFLYRSYLEDLGYNTGKGLPTEEYNLATYLATLRFQFNHSLPVTGNASPETQKKAAHLSRQVKKNILQLEDVSAKEAIKIAALVTNVPESWLRVVAQLESKMNPTAVAHTGDATGLFQFKENAHLKAIYHHGKDIGMKKTAEQVQFSGNDVYLKTTHLMPEVLKLRQNPLVSALMAGKTLSACKIRLQKKFGNAALPDVYLCHVLGESGSEKMLQAKAVSPAKTAADIAPAAAQNNKPLFYDRATGKPLTVTGMYAGIEQKTVDAARAALK